MDTTTVEALSFKTQLITQLLGDVELAMLIACIFWASIGTIISFLMNLVLRDPNSPNSPVQFSGRVFLEQNYIRIILNALVLVTAIIFYTNLYGKPLSTFWALLLGLSLDQLIIGIDKIRKRGQKLNMNP